MSFDSISTQHKPLVFYRNQEQCSIERNIDPYKGIKVSLSINGIIHSFRVQTREEDEKLRHICEFCEALNDEMRLEFISQYPQSTTLSELRLEDKLSALRGLVISQREVAGNGLYSQLQAVEEQLQEMIMWLEAIQHQCVQYFKNYDDMANNQTRYVSDYSKDFEIINGYLDKEKNPVSESVFYRALADQNHPGHELIKNAYAETRREGFYSTKDCSPMFKLGQFIVAQRGQGSIFEPGEWDAIFANIDPMFNKENNLLTTKLRNDNVVKMIQTLEDLVKQNRSLTKTIITSEVAIRNYHLAEQDRKFCDETQHASDSSHIDAFLHQVPGSKVDMMVIIRAFCDKAHPCHQLLKDMMSESLKNKDVVGNRSPRIKLGEFAIKVRDEKLVFNNPSVKAYYLDDKDFLPNVIRIHEEAMANRLSLLEDLKVHLYNAGKI